MKRPILTHCALAVYALLLTSLAWGQGQNFPGGGTSSSSASVVTSGLMAQYPFLSGSLADASGGGQTATGIGSPTALTGEGFSCNGTSQAISVPAALNSAVTIQLFMSYQPASALTYIPAIIIGNGAPANTAGLVLRTRDFWANGTGGAMVGSPFGAQFTTIHAGNSGNQNFKSMASGAFMVTLELNAGGDLLFLNTSPSTAVGGPFSIIGTQTAGSYQICGAAAGQGFALQSFAAMNIYYALFYSTQLTTQQIAQNYAAVTSQVAQYGVTPTAVNANPTNFLQLDGDSETFFPCCGFLGDLTIPDAWQTITMGVGGDTACNLVAEVPADITNGSSLASKNVFMLWAGTNDCAAATPVSNIMGCLAQVSRFIKSSATAAGPRVKTILGSMMSRTSQDTCKNNLDTLERQVWRNDFDAFADIASDANLGADGASANTTYFSDGIHGTSGAQINNEAVLWQRSLRRLYGHNDWSTATTYTTGAAAASAITAASESSATATITTALNPPVGSCVVVSGVTPAGYNSAAGHCWLVQTSSGTQFTYANYVSALGVGTVFGTASVPLQTDEDVYVILGGSAAGNPSFTLESCMGTTGQNVYLKNSNTTSAWVLTPFGSETIDGAATLTMPTASSGNNPVVILQSTLVSSSAAGCAWKRLQ